ncbi:MAG TPA: serine/threonine-protein kinase [Planctomycetota bacterium]|nr:serine/threonine-protein kinase [Planctomycetota bacterium]
MTDLVGRTIAQCPIQRKLGEGGMGAVYLALHPRLRKPVAVKILPAERAASAEYVERFLREARTAARLEHPNVVQVYDAGVDGGLHYILMQYVEGPSLEQVLRDRKTLGVGEALSLAKRVASALDAARRFGIVHRDIKPANILISREGIVKVADFGLARDLDTRGTVSGSGQIVGTPFYMAPEQASAGVVDPRSDLYSLGATLYHALGGRRPFEGDSPLSVVVKVLGEDPVPLRAINPAVPPGVEALVRRMMSKRPEDRPASGEEVIAAIDALKAAPTEAAPRPPKRRSAIVALPLAGLVLLGIAMGLVLGRSKPPPAEAPAPPVARPAAAPEPAAPAPPAVPARRRLLDRLDASARRELEAVLSRADELFSAIQSKDADGVRGLLDRLTFGDAADAYARGLVDRSTEGGALEGWELEDAEAGERFASTTFSLRVRTPQGEARRTAPPIRWVRRRVSETWYVLPPPGHK